MIFVNFKQGPHEKINTIPITNGNLIIGFNSDNTANMYIDGILENKLCRFHIGQFDENYIRRITELESDVTTLKQLANIKIDSFIPQFIDDNGQSILITMLNDNDESITVEYNAA